MPSAPTLPGIRASLVGRVRRFVDFEMALMEQSMRESAPHASGRLVDVGCGEKPYESIFAPYVTQYVGVEYENPDAPSGHRVRHRADVLYSGERLPFADGEFDTVLCNQVAEHVPDPAVLFRELTRVLKPGGRLITTVPFSYRVHFEPTDYHRFTHYALTRYAEMNGLDVDVLRARGGFWMLVGQKLMSRFAVRYARLRGELQAAGSQGYEPLEQRRPRYWTLPVVAPAIVAIAAGTRLLEKIDPDEGDTLGYLLIATKRKTR